MDSVEDYASHLRVLRATRIMETSRVFAAVPLTRQLISWVHAYLVNYGECRSLVPLNALNLWQFGDISGCLTCWAPAPEWADQLIIDYLTAWVENPWTSSAVFVIPRVFQRRWSGLSRYVLELGTVAAVDVPGYTQTDIPVVIMYVPSHVRSLPPPDRSMDLHAGPPGPAWHWRQAEYVRRLQGGND